MVALVEDSINEEELCGEPSQKLLIIDRCPLRIFLNLEIPFHFMKPSFVCYSFSVGLVAVCYLIQPLDSDSGSLVVPFDFEHR